MRSLLIFLFLATPCFSQTVSLSVSSTAIERVKEGNELIIVTHAKVKPGQIFGVRIKGDVPYKIQPDNLTPWIDDKDDKTGDRNLMFFAGEESVTVIVETQEIRIPITEAVAAPSFENQESLSKWLRSYSVPLIDSKTVLVDGSPDPDPQPDPDPDPGPSLSDTAKKVKGWSEDIGNKVEAKQLAENYASITSAINAGAYNSLSFEDARAKIVADVFALNRKVSENNEEWGKFFRNLLALTQSLDEQGKLSTVTQIKDFFEEIKTGLEASL